MGVTVNLTAGTGTGGDASDFHIALTGGIGLAAADFVLQGLVSIRKFDHRSTAKTGIFRQIKNNCFIVILSIELRHMPIHPIYL